MSKSRISVLLAVRAWNFDRMGEVSRRSDDESKRNMWRYASNIARIDAELPPHLRTDCYSDDDGF
jgi:hypothetical protein